MSKSEKWRKRKQSPKCYNGSASDHKTREGMPCGNYSTQRADTQILFEEYFDFLTSVPQRRLQKMILASCMKGNSGKMTDFGENSTAHRTTYVHFLAKGRWDDKQLEETQNVRAFRQFWNFLTSMGRPSLSVLMIQFCPKQRHLQKRNGQHREPDGTILIWKARLSMGIRSMLPSLGPKILHCAIP